MANIPSHRTLHIRHFYDFYEVEVRNNTIVKVTKFVGESQHPRELTFEHLPVNVQEQIVQQLNGHPDDYV